MFGRDKLCHITNNDAWQNFLKAVDQFPGDVELERTPIDTTAEDIF